MTRGYLSDNFFSFLDKNLDVENVMSQQITKIFLAKNPRHLADFWYQFVKKVYFLKLSIFFRANKNAI